MSQTTITDIGTVGIPVSDQDKAVEFFTGTLGFEKRLDAPISPTLRWVEVAPPGASTSIALTTAESGPGAATDTGIRFAVPDAATEHRSLAGRGVDVGELLQWQGVPPMFSFDDPDGNRFYVVQEAS